MYTTKQQKLISHINESRKLKKPQYINCRNEGVCRVVYQNKEDLNYQLSDLLDIIRIKCEEIMWGPKSKNTEVQIGLDGTTLIIGYNTNSFVPQKIANVDDINKIIKENMYSYVGKVKINNVKTIKTFAKSGNFHAEMMIIVSVINEILDNIIKGNLTGLKEIFIRGKKFTCIYCQKFIKMLDENESINKFIKIHTPSQVLFQSSQRGESAKWDNPLCCIDFESVKKSIHSNDKSIAAFIEALIKISNMNANDFLKYN